MPLILFSLCNITVTPKIKKIRDRMIKPHCDKVGTAATAGEAPTKFDVLPLRVKLFSAPSFPALEIS